jgi:hypothetical protein
MSRNETEKEMCLRHVREGEKHVAGQRSILARLRAAQHPVQLAEQLLTDFERSLDTHQTHLTRVLVEESKTIQI